MVKRMRSSVKKQFILQHPISTPVSEVVRAAPRAGLSLTEGYVYIVRRGAAAGGARAKLKTLAPPQTQGTEQLFMTSALEIGLRRATEILQRLRGFAD
jgi:hypothetical protein